MHLYRLEVTPPDSEGEGENWDEWFGSLTAAKKRRAELIKADPKLEGHRYGEDFEIQKIRFKDLPKKALLLATLRGIGCWAEAPETVVLAYRPPRRKHVEDDDE